jgi:hypothetical protein
MEAKTIDEVITRLEDIITACKKKEDSLGYFAALYHQVTLAVKLGIANGYFADGPRMEKLDVLFANRYLNAYSQYRRSEPCTTSWQYAFDTSKEYWPTVLQNLLLGMNAHINLDLGIAAAQLCPGESIHLLKEDFNKINSILSNLVESVEKNLGKIWPRLTYILKKVGKADSYFVDFSMKCARDGAWKFAIEYAQLPDPDHEACIQSRDVRIAEIAKLVSKPGFFISSLLLIIRLGEVGSVSKKIDQLCASTTPVAVALV